MSVTTYTIRDHELSILLNIFLQGNFQRDRKIEAKDFQHFADILTCYEDMLENSTASPTDYEANVREACRLAKRNDVAKEIIDADQYNTGFAIEQMRLRRVQGFIENLGRDMFSMSNREIQQSLSDFIMQEPQEGVISEVDVRSNHESYSRELDTRREQFEKTGSVGFLSGISKVDEMLSIEPGHLVTLAARPSIGKSALALNVGYNAAMYGAKVLYLSLEMSPTELTNRLYASILKISNTRFKYGSVDKALLAVARQEIEAMPGSLRFIHCPGLRNNSIEALIKRRPVDIVILDHIDLMQLPAKKGENEASAIGRITANLKACASKHNVAVICLSQFNRESKGGFPEVHQLRGSGAKEQDSDIVMILHRELDPDADPTAILRVAKNRNGVLGDIVMTFDGPTTTFK